MNIYTILNVLLQKCWNVLIHKIKKLIKNGVWIEKTQNPDKFNKNKICKEKQKFWRKNGILKNIEEIILCQHYNKL